MNNQSGAGQQWTEGRTWQGDVRLQLIKIDRTFLRISQRIRFGPQRPRIHIPWRAGNYRRNWKIMQKMNRRISGIPFANSRHKEWETNWHSVLWIPITGHANITCLGCGLSWFTTCRKSTHYNGEVIDYSNNRCFTTSARIFSCCAAKLSQGYPQIEREIVYCTFN